LVNAIRSIQHCGGERDAVDKRRKGDRLTAQQDAAEGSYASRRDDAKNFEGIFVSNAWT
jgi:hypothetical protein